MKRMLLHLYKRVFNKYDTRVYNTGRIDCPFCKKDSCVIRIPRKGWKKIIPFGKLYHCTDTGHNFLAVWIFSKYGICRERRVRRRY